MHRCYLECWRELFLLLFLTHTVCLRRLWWRCFMSYLVFMSISSFSLVHFKKWHEYLTRETAQAFIPLISFLLYSLVSSSFLVLLRYSFLIFLSSPFICWCPLPIFPSILVTGKWWETSAGCSCVTSRRQNTPDLLRKHTFDCLWYYELCNCVIQVYWFNPCSLSILFYLL